MQQENPAYLGRWVSSLRLWGSVTLSGEQRLSSGFPWGSYATGFDALLPTVGGLVQALSTLVFTAGLIALNIDLVWAKVVPLWVAPVLMLGGLTTFFLTPAIWLPGAAWLLLGLVLWSPRDGAELKKRTLTNLYNARPTCWRTPMRGSTGRCLRPTAGRRTYR